MKKLNLTNQKFGKWRVLKRSKKPSYWLCVCECGRQYEVFLGSLRGGKSTQCIKCQGKQIGSKNATKHGMHKSSEYISWKSMKQRCYLDSKDHKSYKDLNIKVCDNWFDSFENFYKDMGPKPTSKHTIDRIDPKKGYYLENCRWATQKEQNRNKIKTRYVIWDNERISLSDLYEKLNLKETKNLTYYALVARIFRYGWDVKKAVTVPNLHK